MNYAVLLVSNGKLNSTDEYVMWTGERIEASGPVEAVMKSNHTDYIVIGAANYDLVESRAGITGDSLRELVKEIAAGLWTNCYLTNEVLATDWLKHCVFPSAVMRQAVEAKPSKPKPAIPFEAHRVAEFDAAKAWEATKAICKGQ